MQELEHRRSRGSLQRPHSPVGGAEGHPERPAVGRREESGDVALIVRALEAQELLALLDPEREISGTELGQPARRPQLRHPDGQRTPRGDDDPQRGRMGREQLLDQGRRVG